MNIVETAEDGKTVLTVTGNIDSNTANDLQQAILTAFTQNDHVILDLSGVGYSSSVGLRALLLGHKTAMSKGGSMVIRGVGPALMGIINTVGFDKVLNIQ